MVNLWNNTTQEDDLEQQQTDYKKNVEDGDVVSIVANRGDFELFVNKEFVGKVFTDQDLNSDKVVAVIEF